MKYECPRITRCREDYIKTSFDPCRTSAQSDLSNLHLYNQKEIFEIKQKIMINSMHLYKVTK
jgi:hypothetical protein